MNYYGSHLICQSLKLSVSLWSKCQNEYEQNFYDLVCLSSVAISDGQYVAPLMKTANYHAETANTYMYAFSYSTQSESPSSAQDKEDTSVKKIYLYFLRMVVVCYNCNTDICMQCGFFKFQNRTVSLRIPIHTRASNAYYNYWFTHCVTFSFRVIHLITV